MCGRPRVALNCIRARCFGASPHRCLVLPYGGRAPIPLRVLSNPLWWSPQNLLRAGFDVVLYNRTRAVAEAVVDSADSSGRARVVDTPGAVATAGCSVILSCLANERVGEEALLGPDGVFEALKRAGASGPSKAPLPSAAPFVPSAAPLVPSAAPLSPLLPSAALRCPPLPWSPCLARMFLVGLGEIPCGFFCCLCRCALCRWFAHSY